MEKDKQNDPLRERLEKEKKQEFKERMDKENRWIPLGGLLIAIAGLTVAIVAIFSLLIADKLLSGELSYYIFAAGTLAVVLIILSPVIFYMIVRKFF